MTAPAARAIASLCVIAGCFLIATALGFLSPTSHSMQAPRAVVVIAGLVFWLVAGSLLFGAARPALNAALGGSVLALFAIIGTWAAIFGAGDTLRGGLPFVSATTNQWTARMLFGGGAVICAAFAIYAFRSASRLSRHHPQEPSCQTRNRPPP